MSGVGGGDSETGKGEIRWARDAIGFWFRLLQPWLHPQSVKETTRGVCSSFIGWAASPYTDLIIFRRKAS